MTTKKKSYVCPNCKQKQKLIRSWHTASIGYAETIDGDLIDEDPKIADGSHFEAYACYECDADLPNEIIKSLEL